MWLEQRKILDCSIRNHDALLISAVVRHEHIAAVAAGSNYFDPKINANN